MTVTSTAGSGGSKLVGTSVPRVDGPEKVTGSAVYGLDAQMPGMLWMKILRSPFPHARIVSVDTSAASALPGVHLVLTGEDVKGKLTGGMIKDMPLLAWDRVMLVGDKVAAVVADDEDIAQQAIGLIDIEYEELPAILAPEDAMAEDAPILHPNAGSYEGMPPRDEHPNRYAGIHFAKGDVDAGFADADHVIEQTYRTPLLHQGYLEPHACLVYVDDEGVLQVWNANDTPTGALQEMQRLYELDDDAINFNFNYVGGSFGGKSSGTDVALAYEFNQRTGRPIKWTIEYDEEFQNMTMRHPATMRVKAGVKSDGTITAWESEVYFAGGGYAAYAPLPAIMGIVEIVGPYRIANVKVDSHQVFTNTSPCTYARAPGHVQAHFAGESHMDVLAKAIGMDPMDFRLHNVVEPGEEYPTGEEWENVQAGAALRRAAEAAGYYDPKPEGVGRGVAIGSHSQIGATGSVAVKVMENGRVEVNHPVFDPGTGTGTIIAQIVADELDIPIDRIDVVTWSTREGKTGDMGIAGSRGARMFSTAGFNAMQEVKGRLQRLTSEFMGWDEERLTIQAGHIVNGANADERIAIEDIARRFGEPVGARTDEMEGFDSPWNGYGVHVVDVSVDPDTAEVTPLRYTAVHETGRVLNPMGFTSQIEGGIVQSIGSALMEGLFYDESGRVMNPSFADMKLPTARDIPSLDVVVMESDDGHGPLRARGIGEHANSMAAPAIANAVADSIGARVNSLPITAEKVYQELK